MAHPKRRESRSTQNGLNRFAGAVTIPTNPVDRKQGAGSRKKRVYLTKRLLMRLSDKAFREASQEAMRVMGYIVIEHHGWVVKKFQDGRIEKILELEKSKGPLIFD